MVKRKVPDRNTLQRWVEQGLTHEEMAHEIERLTHEPITRAAVSQALQREGLSDNEPRQRYRHEIPWRVRTEHLHAYPIRMLRLLGRRNAQTPLNRNENARLDSWLAKLAQDDLVVAYDPDTLEGFFYVDREDEDPEDVPVRRRRVWLEPPPLP